jgi:hypothetical protein
MSPSHRDAGHREAKAASIGGLFHCPSRFQMTASAEIRIMHMMMRPIALIR